MKLFIDITKSIYRASSNCELFIMLMQLLNGAQLLYNLSIGIMCVCITAAVFATVIAPLTSIYALP